MVASSTLDLQLLQVFDRDAHLVHTTSVLKYSVFINGKNYSGLPPNILEHSLLPEMIDTY